ncbi:MAG TPA: zf-HC2 domain-containing protein [Armatimonadota bacterium]|jgi:hypothetical protein
MQDHITATTRERYLRHTLDAAELLDLDGHIAVCEQCREGLRSARILPGDISALLAAFALEESAIVHPEIETWSAFVRETLMPGERLALDAHLAKCPGCKADVEDLRAFDREMAVHRNKTLEPDGSPAGPAGSTGSVRENRDRRGRAERRATMWWAPAASHLSWAVVPATVVALIIGLPAWRLADSKRADARRIARLEQQAGEAAQRTEALDGAVRRARAENAALHQQLNGLKKRPSFASPPTTQSGPPRPAPPISLGEAIGNATAAITATLSPTTEAQVGRGAASARVTTSPLQPSGTAILSVRPILTWNRPPGATFCELELKPVHGAGKPLVTRTTDTHWRVPRPLSRGRIYEWTAIPCTDDGPLPNITVVHARFRVLGTKQADAVRRERLSVVRRYVDAGLMRDATREVDSMLESDPEEPALLGLRERLRRTTQRMSADR